MNTDRVLVVFGSALTSLSPRDIDVVCEGEFGEEEESLVRTWAKWKGLPDLPIDVKIETSLWRGAENDRVAELNLGTFRTELVKYYRVLRGDVHVFWHCHHALPARIRRAANVDELLATLRCIPEGVDGRMAVLDNGDDRSTRADWHNYFQGRLALRNAIAKCPFWELAEMRDPRVRFVRLLSTFGVDESVRERISSGGQAGAGNGFVHVTLEGITLKGQSLLNWTEVLPKSALG